MILVPLNALSQGISAIDKQISLHDFSGCDVTFQGGFFPCFTHLWALWAPPNEISRLYAIQSSGISWGNVFSFALSGVLCQSLGWEWVFYMYGESYRLYTCMSTRHWRHITNYCFVSGIWGAVFMFFWAFFAYDSPDTHPRISEKERKYIKESLGNSDAKDQV